jgi:hypothetical protein
LLKEGEGPASTQHLRRITWCSGGIRPKLQLLPSSNTLTSRYPRVVSVSKSGRVRKVPTNPEAAAVDGLIVRFPNLGVSPVLTETRLNATPGSFGIGCRAVLDYQKPRLANPYSLRYSTLEPVKHSRDVVTWRAFLVVSSRTGGRMARSKDYTAISRHDE